MRSERRKRGISAVTMSEKVFVSWCNAIKGGLRPSES